MESRLLARRVKKDPPRTGSKGDDDKDNDSREYNTRW